MTTSSAGLLAALPGNRMIWVLYGAIWIGVVLAHYHYLSTTGNILLGGDGGRFYDSTLPSLTSKEFWNNMYRPSGAVLFWKFFSSYKAFGNKFLHEQTGEIVIDDVGLMWAHTVLCIFAWTSLALACARAAYNSRMRLVLFTCPLVISLLPQVAMWNFIARNESFSLSLFVIFISFWILFLRTRYWVHLVIIALVAILWAGAREANAYVLVMIAIVLFGAIIKNISGEGGSWFPVKSISLLAIWFLVVFAGMSAHMDHTDRWQFSFFNVMGKRILEVPGYVDYFENHGMPINEALHERRGKYTSDDNYAFYDDPDLDEFRAWTDLHGKTTYMKFLVSHPIYLITGPLPNNSREFTKFENRWYKGYTHPDFQPLIALRIPAGGVFLVLLGAIPFLFSVRRHGWGWVFRHPWATVPVMMILLSFPHAWLTWHGDAMEVDRHGFLAVFHCHLGFVLLGLFACDMMLHGKDADRDESNGPLPGPS